MINIKPEHRQEQKDWNEIKATCMVSMSYIKGLSENCKRTGNVLNTITTFNTRNTVESILRKLRPNKDLLDKLQCAYRIPCECGRKYAGETSRPLGTRLNTL
jgi:hypothetical protein